MIKKRNRLSFSFLLSIVFVVFFSFNLVKAQDEPLYKIPELQIQIDGVEFSEVNCDVSEDGKTSCQVPWIAQYIKGIYQYAISIGGILAAIVLMAGGIFWLISAGSADRINKAKSLISGSLIGLFILLTSYVILYEINPNLVQFKKIEIGKIDLIIEGDSNVIPVDFDVYKIAERLNIKCKKENSIEEYDSLEEMAKKTVGKITYNQTLRGSFVDKDKVYLDCSSYVHFLLKCSGIDKSPAMYTGDFFSPCFLHNKLLKDQPGDLVGWSPSQSKNKTGHVFICVGNNTYYEVHGGKSGRSSGGAVGIHYSQKKIHNIAEKHTDGFMCVKEAPKN